MLRSDVVAYPERSAVGPCGPTAPSTPFVPAIPCGPCGPAVPFDTEPSAIKYSDAVPEGVLNPEAVIAPLVLTSVIELFPN